MGKTYIRVDDRLVHGQITTNWIGNLNIDQILVVDDKTATNSMLKSIMLMAIPKNISSDVISIDNLNDETIQNGSNCLIIVKYPSAIPEVIKKIKNISKVIVGTVVDQEGSRKITKHVYLTEEYENALNFAKEHCEVSLQQLPDSSSVPWQGV